MQGMQCLLACLLACLLGCLISFYHKHKTLAGKSGASNVYAIPNTTHSLKSYRSLNSKDTSFFHKNSRVLIFNAFFGFVMIALHLQW
jgi:hypothetical protein